MDTIVGYRNKITGEVVCSNCITDEELKEASQEGIDIDETEKTCGRCGKQLVTPK
jgi:hypothetical protein